MLREQKVKQRLRYVWLIGSLIVALGLGGATAYGVWITNRTPFSYVGLIAGVGSTAAAAWLILKHRPTIANEAYELAQLENKHMLEVAVFERNVQQSLRIYRAASRGDIESYRADAKRNRRIHNAFQGLIIVGSIAVTSRSTPISPNLPEVVWLREGERCHRGSPARTHPVRQAAAAGLVRLAPACSAGTGRPTPATAGGSGCSSTASTTS